MYVCLNRTDKSTTFTCTETNVKTSGSNESTTLCNCNVSASASNNYCKWFSVARELTKINGVSMQQMCSNSINAGISTCFLALSRYSGSIKLLKKV